MDLFLPNFSASDLFVALLLQHTESPITYEEFKEFYKNQGYNLKFLEFIKEIIHWYSLQYSVCKITMEMNCEAFNAINRIAEKTDLMIEDASIPIWIEQKTHLIILEYFSPESVNNLQLNPQETQQLLLDYSNGRMGIGLFKSIFSQLFNKVLVSSFKDFQDIHVQRNITKIDRLNRSILLSYSILTGSILLYILFLAKSPTILNIFLLLPVCYYATLLIISVLFSFCSTTAKLKLKFTQKNKIHSFVDIKDLNVIAIQQLKSKKMKTLSKCIGLLLASLVSYAIHTRF